MINNFLQIFGAPRSPRFVHGQLTARAVREVFGKTRTALGAHTQHVEYRQRNTASAVVWSLWIGRFKKPVPWLASSRYVETRYAFVLVLEFGGYIGVLSNNAGDVAHLVADGRVSYQKLIALRSGDGAEIESLSTRSLRAARVGVAKSMLSGRHLERVVSRVGANQAAPSQVTVRHADQALRISPGTGRVALAGGRASIPDLCAWFAATCQEIDGATEPSDFLKAFAHPISLVELPQNVEPMSLQLDPTVLDELLEVGATLRTDNRDLDDPEIEALRQFTRELWLVTRPRSTGDQQANTWRMTLNASEVGHLVMRSTKISLVCNRLRDVEVAYEDGTSESLLQVFNGSEQPFRLSFSEPTYSYALGQLFRDHRLLGSRQSLLHALDASLPLDAAVEKADDGQHFTATSLFGFVVGVASERDDLLVCEDMGAEWADFVGVSTTDHRVTFYHCKGGHVDVGASGLHEVVSQATKNLGYLTASSAELRARATRWRGNWNQRPIARLQRGASVDTFIDGFGMAVVAPQATRRVMIVTSSLSKAALSQAFDDLDHSAPSASVVHVLLLLSAFVDQCRAAGAIPHVICRP
jgi:hypothetical protein